MTAKKPHIPSFTRKVDTEIICFADQNISKTDLCIIANGGYGRGELAPHSDIDLLFLTKDISTTDHEKHIKDMQHYLWNKGLKPSAITLPFSDLAEKMTGDLYFLTALMNRRFLYGDKKIFQKLDRQFNIYRDTHDKSVFITAKLAERDARHRKMGDTRYYLEPNVKEGKGGLRDIQTLLWIAGYLYDTHIPEDLAAQKVLTKTESKTLRKAYDFFSAIRFHLHRITGRAEDRLTFPLQPDIALAMGYKDRQANERAEKFMKDYFLMTNETGHLTRILCTMLEAESLVAFGTAGTRKAADKKTAAEFPLTQNRLDIKKSGRLKNSPAEAVRLFRAQQITGYGIHPNALRKIRNAKKSLEILLPEDKTAQQYFLAILLDKNRAEETLRRMNEAGVLGALIPEFKNIIAHMQYDMYHVFTADEHSLRAVGMLHRLEKRELQEQAPLSTDIFKKIQSRRALYVAMFLHDIAKGGGGQHQKKGAQIAKSVCRRLGLALEETETVCWLVAHHLLMTHTAFKRDMNDPKTIEDFVAEVQSLERLKLLTLLTVADIMAVGPDRWNNWKANLLRELYNKASETISGTPAGRTIHERAEGVQDQVEALLKNKSDGFLYLKEYAPLSFWFTFMPEAQASFVRLLEKKTSKTVVRVTPQPEKDFTEVFIHTPDQKGLFSTLAGALSAGGASIAGAQIFTLSNGMALDIFQIQTVNSHVYENIDYLERLIKSALKGKLDIAAELKTRQKQSSKKTRHFSMPARIILDNNASSHYTMIEINAKDRSGLLYDITRALTKENLQISAAKITTFGSRAVDVFYVKDSYGIKITHPDKLLQVEQRLRGVLGV